MNLVPTGWYQNCCYVREEARIEVVTARLARLPFRRRVAPEARPVAAAPGLPILAACLACAIAAVPAVGQDLRPTPRPATDREVAAPGPFTLDLAELPQSETMETDEPRRFDLGLTERTPDEDGGAGVSVGGASVLSFDSPSGWDDRPFADFEFGFDDVPGVLMQRRSADPVELHMARELERVIPGFSPQGLLFALDVDAIVRMIRDWRHRRRDRKLPAAALLPRDAEVTLVVRDTDGGPPQSISVVPLTDGWVGETLHASCDGSGRCFVNGLPGAPSTLLVRGEGAAVVPWRPTDRGLTIRLRPTGTVRLVPPFLERCRPPTVRVVDEASGLVVPVLRWLNPKRGSWVPLHRASLPLVVPVGVYRVEVLQGQGSAPFETIVIDADREAEIEVGACLANS